jgi:hypothetical protein
MTPQREVEWLWEDAHGSDKVPDLHGLAFGVKFGPAS